jgi:hypothetical protein
MDAGEAEFMNSIHRGRSAELENTVFTVLAPDGETPLVRASRSPGMSYGSPERLVKALEGFTERYSKTRKRTKQVPALPVYEDLRLSLDVASCDSRPLLVVWAADEKARAKAAARLSKLAWSDEFVGRYHYAYAVDAEELESIEELPRKKEGLLVIAPGAYGLDGEVIGSAALDAKDKVWSALLEEGLEAYTPVTKDPRNHIRQGHRAGLRWETDIPVTDGPGGRGRRDR